MSTDKLQAVHEALADVFSESPLISTDTEPPHPVFDHEALSDIFSEPHLISANPEHPFRIVDHAALAGIFSEAIPISTNTKPSSPSFDHQALAEILSKQPPTSTNTKSSPPSFDHQGLAEALSELRLVPINPELSPLSFDTGSSFVPSSDQLDNEEPVAKTVAVASSTNAEDARPQRARSLLTKLHHIFSNKAEPPPSGIEKDPFPPSLSGQRHRPEPIAKASAAASPTDAESARPQQAESLLTGTSPQISRNSDLAPLSSEQAPSSTRLSGEPGDVRPAASEVTADFPIGTASALRPRPTSLMAKTSSLISINTDSSPHIFQKKSSPPTVAGRLDNTDPGVRTIAVAAPTDAQYAGPQQAKSLLTELRPLTSAGAEPPPIVEKEPSRLTLSGRVGKVEPAVKTVAVTPPTDAESARAQRAT